MLLCSAAVDPDAIVYLTMASHAPQSITEAPVFKRIIQHSRFGEHVEEVHISHRPTSSRTCAVPPRWSSRSLCASQASNLVQTSRLHSTSKPRSTSTTPTRTNHCKAGCHPSSVIAPFPQPAPPCSASRYVLSGRRRRGPRSCAQAVSSYLVIRGRYMTLPIIVYGHSLHSKDTALPVRSIYVGGVTVFMVFMVFMVFPKQATQQTP